jgi:hypothetical protein
VPATKVIQFWIIRLNTECQHEPLIVLLGRHTAISPVATELSRGDHDVDHSTHQIIFRTGYLFIVTENMPNETQKKKDHSFGLIVDGEG